MFYSSRVDYKTRCQYNDTMRYTNISAKLEGNAIEWRNMERI